MLHNWIKKYKENGYNIVEQNRGCPTMNKVIKRNENKIRDEKNQKVWKKKMNI